MKKTDTFSHYREGKSQMQRFLAELDPGILSYTISICLTGYYSQTILLNM